MVLSGSGPLALRAEESIDGVWILEEDRDLGDFVARVEAKKEDEARCEARTVTSGMDINGQLLCHLKSGRRRSTTIRYTYRDSVVHPYR